MGKIAIVTDSNSGISQKHGEELGIYVLPMPVYINDELHYEDITFTQEDFYKKIAEDADVKTSMPSPGDMMDLWDKALSENDFVVHIPMSSSLSGTCEAATMLAEGDYKGKVFVVDNQRISISMLQSILDAITLRDAGKTPEEIKEILEANKFESFILLSVDTLKYLKKGGRISPAAAALGTMLNLKPVLSYRGEKIEPHAKVRGSKAAKKAILAGIEAEMKEKFGDDLKNVLLQTAHSCTEEEGQLWLEEVATHFPQFKKEDILVDKLALSVACHTGPGVVALACTKKISI